MKDIKVVIGKNFGDEGKGQAVSDFCKGQAALVVRHNGGAQAGHTVEAENFRFVFHQLGSGSLWGCPTYWSKTFLPDLLKLGEEAEAFQAAVSKMTDVVNLGEVSDFKATEQMMDYDRTVIYAHPDCACTVIYDVLLNSLTEQLRGERRHGSCGMGIYEAVLRSRETEYRLCLRDFSCVEREDSADRNGITQEVQKDVAKLTADKRAVAGQPVDRIAAKLEKIRQEYTFPRLKQLREQHVEGWEQPEVREWVSLIENDNLLWNVAEEMCANYAKYVRLTELDALWGQYDRIVFENAQGLMLDEDNMEYYPHLTPSHTGLYNVAELLAKLLEGASLQDMDNACCKSAEMDVCCKSAGANDSHKSVSLQASDEINLEVIYVTRTYVTRHGAGRLDHECTKDEINPQMEDATNIPNPWQNSLRFARHPAADVFFRQMLTDLDKLKNRHLTEKLQIAVTLRLTHLDETDDRVLFVDKDMDTEELREICREKAIALELV